MAVATTNKAMCCQVETGLSLRRPVPLIQHSGQTFFKQEVEKGVTQRTL